MRNLSRSPGLLLSLKLKTPTTTFGKCWKNRIRTSSLLPRGPSSHLKNVLEAVRCGVKGILVEKPIAVNTSQLEQMIQVTEKCKHPFDGSVYVSASPTDVGGKAKS